MTKRRAIIYTLIWVIVILWVLNPYFYFVDPRGVILYQDNLQGETALKIDAPEGYQYVEGTHTLRNGYTFVIGADGNRIVPDTPETADCTIVFVGDSVTFGLGANNSYVDTVQALIPDVQFINTAKGGYSTLNVLPSIEEHPADGYIYYAVLNDEQPMRNYEDYTSSTGWNGHQVRWWTFEPTRIYFAKYALPKLQPAQTAQAPYYGQWQADMNTLKQRDDLLILAWDETTAQLHDLPMPEYEKLVISHADGHLTDEGNVIAGEAIAPYVREWLPTVCNKRVTSQG